MLQCKITTKNVKSVLLNGKRKNIRKNCYIDQVTMDASLPAEMVHSVKKKCQSENFKLNGKRSNERERNNYLLKVNAEYTVHMKTYKKIITFYALLGKVFGAKISYDWIPHHNLFYYITSFFLSLVAVNIMYTILYHCKNDDYVRIFEPLAVIGITASCALKWYGFLKYFRKIYSLLFFPRKLCLENTSGCRADIIATGLRKTWSILKAYTVGVVALLCFFAFVPIYFFFAKNMWIPLAPLEIIFIDQSTLSGYLYASTIHLITGAYAGCATIMYGSAFLICICNYTFLIDLVGQDFSDLDRMWKNSSETTVTQRYSFLCNICMKIQDIERYLDVVKEIYQRKFFIYFLVNYIAQVICLYEIRKNDWIPGYTIALMLFVEMMSYCLIGTQISFGDDRLCSIIYGTNWYTYDLVSQNVIRVLLHDCQKPKHIMLGNFGPLDVVTGSTILKSIYTLYTVMMEAM